MNNFKTTMLLASMIAMLVLLGNAFGGARGYDVYVHLISGDVICIILV